MRQNVHGYIGGPHTPAMGYTAERALEKWPEWPEQPRPGEAPYSPGYVERMEALTGKSAPAWIRRMAGLG